MPESTDLRSLLATKEWTQQALADAMGVTQPTVANWLSKNFVPRERVPKFIEVTGIMLDELNAALYPDLGKQIANSERRNAAASA